MTKKGRRKFKKKNRLQQLKKRAELAFHKSRLTQRMMTSRPWPRVVACTEPESGKIQLYFFDFSLIFTSLISFENQAASYEHNTENKLLHETAQGRKTGHKQLPQ